MWMCTMEVQIRDRYLIYVDDAKQLGGGQALCTCVVEGGMCVCV